MTTNPQTDEQTIKPTLGEDIRELFSRVAKLNDAVSALLAPAWGSEVGIIPADHPLYVGEQPAAPAAGRVVSAASTRTDEARRERYAVAIHDAMESDLSLVDQEPAVQALFARAAEAAVALADTELATVLRHAATLAERLPVADRYRHHSKLCDAWDDGRDAIVRLLRRLAVEAQQQEPARSDVGTEFVRQADQPDEAGLAAFETDLAEAQQQPDTETQSALMRAHVALAEQAGRDQATLARVRRLYESGPLGTCCAHLVGAALNQPAVVVEQPAAADSGEEA